MKKISKKLYNQNEYIWNIHRVFNNFIAHTFLKYKLFSKWLWSNFIFFSYYTMINTNVPKGKNLNLPWIYIYRVKNNKRGKGDERDRGLERKCNIYHNNNWKGYMGWEWVRGG